MSNLAKSVRHDHLVPAGETPSEYSDGTPVLLPHPFFPPPLFVEIDLPVDSTLSFQLADGQFAVITPLTFGRARICRQQTRNAEFYDDSW